MQGNTGIVISLIFLIGLLFLGIEATITYKSSLKHDAGGQSKGHTRKTDWRS